MDYITEHQNKCKLDSDTCEKCFFIQESLHALNEAQENKPKIQNVEPKTKKLVWNKELREWTKV